MLLADDVPRPDDAESTVGTLHARLVGAVTLANQSIYATGARHRGPGMATTFAGVLVERDCSCVVHLGDSRVYRLRDGGLEALTQDHNVANELMWRGAPPEFVRERRDRGHLSRALGSTPNPELAVRIESARPGDLLLLSTDGLHRVVPEDEIVSILLEADGVDVAVDSLIGRANERGGPDNVTAVVVRWTALGSTPHGGTRA
jgi:protein phosphatase